MERPTNLADAQNEIQFLLSLLHISTQGQPVPQQTAIEQLLTIPASR